jgi:hypothetical protein
METYLVRQASDQTAANGQKEVIRQIRVRALGIGVFHSDALAQRLRSEHAHDVIDEELRVNTARG